MRHIFTCLMLLVFGELFAQQPIVYQLDLSNIEHHELGIQIDFPALAPQPLVLRMPAASPGRYALHNFAKNVYKVEATDVDGKALAVSRTGLHEWTVANHGGRAQVTYTLFANRADGTYSKVDNRKLHLNMPATFLYGKGLSGRPIELVIPLDDYPNWSVATQLEKVQTQRFRAPNYYYFFDSPTMVSDIRFRRWTVGQQTIEMAFMTPDPDSLLDQYAEWTKAIVAEQERVYGELPEFDFSRYTFLCAYNPYVDGDGMEHRNSTVCSAPVSLEHAKDRLIGTISHEFFHCWNVERIRPASLEPFDFDEPNLSGELWFAEGFTSYYDDLSLVRSGVVDVDTYLQGLTGSLNYVLLRPGSELRGPIGMSQCAPFVDAATALDPTNFSNTFISYYPYGAVLGMALDLRLRRDFDTNLDEYMQRVWTAYGKTEIPYNIPDLEHQLAILTKNEAFAKEWFARHVYGHEMPPLRDLLNSFGVSTPPRHAEEVNFYGMSITEKDSSLVVGSNMYRTNPLYSAGLELNDAIISIADQEVFTKSDWDDVRLRLEAGVSYPIRYRQNGVEKTSRFVAALDPTFKVQADAEANRKNKRLQRSWLNQE